jgi:hypothetical protein
MSCYQVDPDLIDLVVSELFRTRYLTPGGVTLYFDAAAVVHTDAMRDLIQPSGADGLSMIYVSAADLADVVGRELVAANVASVRCRYPNDDLMVGYLPDDYSWRRVSDDRFATAGHVLGACRGFRYQTCECGDERSSVWGAVIDEVERLAGERLAGDAFGDGWSWSREWQAGQIAAARVAVAS